MLLAAAVAAPAALASPSAQAIGGPKLPVRWQVPTIGNVQYSSPTVGDLNGDGAADIVVGTLGGRLHAVTAATGAALPGWPAGAVIQGAPTAVDSGPVIADLDRDGSNELIVGAISRQVPDQHGGLIVFDRNGGVRCRFRPVDIFDAWAESGDAGRVRKGGNTNPADGFTEGVYSTPAVGDVNGDGRLDIVFGAKDHHIYVLDSQCRQMAKFLNDDSIWSSPALYDVNGDGRQEIFIGTASSSGGPEDWSGGLVRALTWWNNGLGEIWKKRVKEVQDTAPAIGDINGDGRAELIIGSGWDYRNDDSYKVSAWHLDDGSNVPGWPVRLQGPARPSPAIGDVTGDGVAEVVIGSQGPNGRGDGQVYVFSGNGGLLWARAPQEPGEGGGEIVGTAVIVDLNADGVNDVGIGNGWGVFAMRGTDGTRLWEPLVKARTFKNGLAVANTGAGWVLVAAGSAEGGLITAIDIPTPATTPGWTKWRGSPELLPRFAPRKIPAAYAGPAKGDEQKRLKAAEAAKKKKAPAKKAPAKKAPAKKAPAKKKK